MASNTDSPVQKLPPMMQQYLEYKDKYPDCLLFFQVGDFYELFFDDAVQVSRTLNLTLTSRDKNSPQPVPMAGVPIAAVEGYLERLVALGFSVALVSQLEIKPGQKGMVERKLDRIITPGIGILGNGEASGEQAFVAAAFLDGDLEGRAEGAIAYADFQSAEVWVRDGVLLRGLSAEMSHIMPREIILPQNIGGRRIDRRLSWIKELEGQLAAGALKLRPDSYYNGGVSAERDLTAIPGYSALSPSARKAARLLINYADEVTGETRFNISSIAPKGDERTLGIDAAARRTLELVSNSRDGSKLNTLYEYMDRSVSAAGSRLIRQWILAPSSDAEEIHWRQAAVACFKEQSDQRRRLRDELKYAADLERCATRIELGVVLARELAALRETLEKGPALQEALGGCAGGRFDIAAFARELEWPEALTAELAVLADSPPFSMQEGGYIRDGFDAELDRLRSIRRSGHAWIAELESKEREKTGISSLKIRYNNLIGYFIEITKANLDKVPDYFIRRQGTVSGERFVTPELKERETEVLNAESRAIELERRIFAAMRERLMPHVKAVRAAGRQLALLDALLSLAELAEAENLVEPEVDQSSDLLIEEGMHPVLSRILGAGFVPNSLELDGRRACVITGPNMGGKSTYLRQAGLICIMAQIGSFVPARRARVGIVDRIFSRMGASDDLAEGESTFMVEMREMASIISNATDRSLLLVDEVGRGTATTDGLSIARSILEWLVVKLKSRVLFATHFHELTALSEVYPTLGNLSVGATERDGQVYFTHHIREGAASRSYGLEVAKLAGLPEMLLQRARSIMDDLQKSTPEKSGRQLAMFGSAQAVSVVSEYIEPQDYQGLKSLASQIEKINVNETTPLQAIHLLDGLKKDLKALGGN